MKPLKLTMSAFGSYGDVQVIDFNGLGTGGLYLITGETGSGKTTIFDAISFALFGKASGSGREDYTMLRSDFAADKTKTYVEMDFISGNQRYHIKRTIKKSGQEAVLLLPDGTAISGDRNIKGKITEIVGLDRDQFAQIVMIAQNDFLRFLQSGTEERLKILRRIFGTEFLKQFQERLKARVKRENDTRVLIIHDFERYGVDVYKREQQFAEWKTQIGTDKAALGEADEQLGKYDSRKQRLAADLAVAEEICRKFDGLAKARRGLEEHNAKADEIAAIKTRALRGEIALHKVKHLADEAQKAAANHDAAQSSLAKAKEQETAAQTALAEAQKAIATLPPLAEAQDAFVAVQREWEAAVEKLKRLAALDANRQEIAAKNSMLAKTSEELASTLEVLSQLPPLAGQQAELDKIGLDLKNEEEKLTKLTQLHHDLTYITDRRASLAQQQAEFEALHAAFQAAAEKHRALEEAFLRGQAGIMAVSLKEGEPCPVCGSASHPAPAKLSGSHVTEQELKAANDAKDKVQYKRDAQSSLCATLKAETDTLVKCFMVDFAALLPHAPVKEALTLLPKMISGSQAAITDLAAQKNSAEKFFVRLTTQIESASQKRDELTPFIASLQAETATLIKRFISDFSEFIPDAIWETAQTKLAKLLSYMQNTVKALTARKDGDKNSLQELSANWDLADKQKTGAESAALAAHTRETERAANEQQQLYLWEEARAAYTTALQENGFFAEEEYRAALMTENELAGLRKQAADHEKSDEQLNRDIARLEKETAGQTRPDIAALRKESETVHAESKELSARRDEINNRLSKREGALKELHRAAAVFEKAEKAYAAIKQLADAANGKLDFETYVQMAYFERVIRAANLRLRLMSQNRYTLLRKTGSDDGRKRCGLELEVLDAYTGKARSANSLSGGESFMASLSLALGLSDVVQQNAGGIHLDAMFIDEGFGTLDTDVLDLAISTLSEMAGTNRIIGIVSHVSELRERIDKQVRVEKTTAGSRISVVL